MLEVWKWSTMHKATLHFGAAKTVGMQLVDSIAHASTEPPIHFNTGETDTVFLEWACVHRWLGILWSADLVFLADLMEKTAKGSAITARIASMIRYDGLPISYALEMFEMKVEGMLKFSKWCWVSIPSLEELLDDAYHKWARMLLLADKWKNAGVIRGELGWSLSGYGRFLCDMASMLGKVLAAEDWYGSMVKATRHHPGCWVQQVESRLTAWNVPRPTLPVSLDYGESAKSIITQACIAKWSDIAATSTLIPRYALFQSRPVSWFPRPHPDPWSWGTLKDLIYYARFRTGQIELRHVNGRRTWAIDAPCIFCQRLVRRNVSHTLGHCSAFSDWRANFFNCRACHPEPGDNIAVFILQTCESDAAFPTLVAWCRHIGMSAESFWASQ